jgi:hypothetical protein
MKVITDMGFYALFRKRIDKIYLAIFEVLDIPGGYTKAPGPGYRCYLPIKAAYGPPNFSSVTQHFSIYSRRIFIKWKYALLKGGRDKLLKTLGQQVPSLTLWHCSQTKTNFSNGDRG